ncbi:MAG: hypothetical protein AAGN46_08575, partial [Acidobacteriota bacterium]
MHDPQADDPAVDRAPRHVTTAELEAAFEAMTSSPRSVGSVEMIVRRPAIGEREVLEAGQLDVEDGLVGDNWRTRGSSRTPDGSAHPEMQLNLMSARVIGPIAGAREHWPLAGDQL